MGRAVVFGAGPAGLLAAHALRRAGMNVEIFAAGHKSTLYGAQYLHREIPGVPCGEPRKIQVTLAGTADGYRTKVYGDAYQGPVSPSALEDGHLAWDIRRAYDWLWNAYSDSIMPLTLTRGNVHEVYQSSIGGYYDVQFCALPLVQLCSTKPGEPIHSWQSQQVYAIGDAPDLGLMCPIGCPDEMMQYDGTPDIGWYRSARIFGHTTCEWPARQGIRKPPLANLAKVMKPIWTNCTCFPRWQRLGRYGKWKKGELTHHAFEDVERWLGNEVQGALFERPETGGSS